jgi:hypothetical protein
MSNPLPGGGAGPRGGKAVVAKMHFLAQDPKYEYEKPYTLRYKPSGNIPQTNIAREAHQIEFLDMRDHVGPDGDLRYEDCGFTVAKLEGGAMSYEDFADREKIEGLHADEVLAAVRGALGAEDVQLVDYVVRRRHPEWPIATGEAYEFQQPASRAHIGKRPDRVLLGLLHFRMTYKK